MLVLLKLVKPKVQLIDQNDLMVNDEDVLHVVVPVVAAQEVKDDSIARVVIQNHPKRFVSQFGHSTKSRIQPFEKKEGSGAGNWGTAEDELQGQTEKVEGETEGEKTEKPEGEEVEQKEEVPPPEPEEKTMTLEEYYASRKKSNRNPNAKLTEEKTPVSSHFHFCFMITIT